MLLHRVAPGVRLVLGLALVLALSGAVSRAQARQFVTLGTGGVTGVYYPAGGAICRLVNADRSRHGLRCSVESTAGSIYNLEAVASGELDLGIAQADWIYGFSHRSDAGMPASSRPLRSLFSLYPELFTVVVRASSDIHRFEDVLGRRVSVGRVGSGQRATLELLLALQGRGLEHFEAALEMDPAMQAEALCSGEIDVMLYMLGHPSGAMKEVTRSCDARIVPVEGEVRDALLQASPVYEPMTIKAGTYPGQGQDIATFGVHATFFTRADLPDEIAHAIVQSLFEDFDRFRRLHPAFRDLDPQTMVGGPFPVPLHPGALRYYRERGLTGF